MKTLKYLAISMVGAMVYAVGAQTTTTVVEQPTPPPPPPSQDQTTIVQTEPSTVVVTNETEPMYRDQEFSIDAFGSLSLGEQFIDKISSDRIRKNGRLGAGAGVNLFFAKNVGIGADAWSEDTRGQFIDNVSGSLIVRLPIGNSGLAPYVFGGGGYEFEPVDQAYGHFGAGLEIRFNPHVGIFVDARYIVPRKTDDFGLGRAGFRFSF
jgi:hypothetical protein